MAREKETYRLELEQILLKFGGRHILSKQDVMEYTGKGRSWCDKHLKIPPCGCTAVQLAFQLSHLGEKFSFMR